MGGGGVDFRCKTSGLACESSVVAVAMLSMFTPATCDGLLRSVPILPLIHVDTKITADQSSGCMSAPPTSSSSAYGWLDGDGVLSSLWHIDFSPPASFCTMRPLVRSSSVALLSPPSCYMYGEPVTEVPAVSSTKHRKTLQHGNPLTIDAAQGLEAASLGLDIVPYLKFGEPPAR